MKVFSILLLVLALTGCRHTGKTIERILSDAKPGQAVHLSGDYVLDNHGRNSSGLLVPRSFHGAVFFDGGRLICTDSSADSGQCVNFDGNSDIQTYNLHITYQDTARLPLPRNACSPNNALIVQGNSRGLSFINTTIDFSPGVGVWNTLVADVSYLNTAIRHTSADGWHAENCANCTVDGYVSDNTGDDAIAFTNLERATNSGGIVHNAHITNSHARGLAIVGTSDITVSQVSIDGTAYDCLAAVVENGYAVSSKVIFSDFHCAEIGYAQPAAGTSGVRHGLEINGTSDVTASHGDVSSVREHGAFIYNNASRVSLDHLMVTSAVGSGVTTSGASYVRIDNTSVYNAAYDGFHLSNLSHSEVSNIKSDSDGGYGVYSSQLDNVFFSGVTIRNSAGKNNGLAWENEFASGPAYVTGLSIVDDRNPAKGYKAGGYQNGAHPVIYRGNMAAISHGTFSTISGGSGEQWGTATSVKPVGR